MVELNRKAVESDLRHLREPEPRADGRRPQVGRPWASAATGASARTTTRTRCASATPTWTRRRARSPTRVDRMGRVTNKALNVFTIETTINNRMFDAPLDVPRQERGRPHAAPRRRRCRRSRFTLDKLPQPRAPGHLPARAVAVRRHRRLRRRDRGGARAHARAVLRAVHRAGRRARPTCSSPASRTSARTT